MRREAPVQRAVVQWLRAVLPDAVVHHARGEINKRGRAIQIELAQARALGAVPGFPDIVVLPPAETGPLFFEVKAAGGYPSPAQREMHGRLRALGYRVAVVRSVDDAQAALAGWGIATRESGWRSVGKIAAALVKGRRRGDTQAEGRDADDAVRRG